MNAPSLNLAILQSCHCWTRLWKIIEQPICFGVLLKDASQSVGWPVEQRKLNKTIQNTYFYYWDRSKTFCFSFSTKIYYSCEKYNETSMFNFQWSIPITKKFSLYIVCTLLLPLRNLILFKNFWKWQYPMGNRRSQIRTNTSLKTNSLSYLFPAILLRKELWTSLRWGREILLPRWEITSSIINDFYSYI